MSDPYKNPYFEIVSLGGLPQYVVDFAKLLLEDVQITPWHELSSLTILDFLGKEEVAQATNQEPLFHLQAEQVANERARCLMFHSEHMLWLARSHSWGNYPDAVLRLSKAQ